MATARKKPAAKRKPAAKPTTRRRRTATRSKGMLSELFNPNMAQAAGKTVLSGAVGGAGAALLGKVLPDDMQPKTKAFCTMAGGFLTASLLKMPNVGAGMAAVGMYNLMQISGFLAEDFEYADDMDKLPLVLDENGVDFLQQNGYLQEGDGYLQEDYNYSMGMFPSFGQA